MATGKASTDLGKLMNDSDDMLTDLLKAISGSSEHSIILKNKAVYNAIKSLSKNIRKLRSDERGLTAAEAEVSPSKKTRRTPKTSTEVTVSKAELEQEKSKNQREIQNLQKEITDLKAELKQEKSKTDRRTPKVSTEVTVSKAELEQEKRKNQRAIQNLQKEITDLKAELKQEKSKSDRKYEKKSFEGSVYVLKEVCDMINCQTQTGSNIEEGIYHLAVAIKSKINAIESQCFDVSEQVNSMQDAFDVQKVNVAGGIRCIPLWKDTLGNILKIKKCEKDQKQDSVTDQDKQTTDYRKTSYKETSTKKVNEKIDYLETELAKENDKNKKLRNDIHTKHEEIMKLKDNVDYWKNRVSKLAGSKLTDNNPGVTDLSDPNRPTRLAEMFNEIYDNVWTDTLEGLNQPKQIATEKKAVEHMASILKVCYEYCANKFQDTLTQVEEILLLNVEKNTDEELYKEECKQLKDMLKLAGVRTSKGLNQDMAIKSVHDPKLRKVMETYKDVTEKFTKQCLEICWLMAVQDPQVVLHWGSLKEGSSINSDHFKCFTRSGTLLEYVVWPAMLLHKDGPFLSKGIVQPLATTNTSTRL